jgi:copper oxidase (laccase) domain-containing protein
MEMIMDDSELQKAGFYWRETDGVRALVCAPLEDDGFTNAFSTRLGGISPMPTGALNLAGFNEDEAENIYENRRRFLKLFDGDWTLTGCWQTHSRRAHCPQ